MPFTLPSQSAGSLFPMTREEKRRTAWIAQLNRWKVNLRLVDGSAIENTQVLAVDIAEIACSKGGQVVQLESVLSIEVPEEQPRLLA